MQMPTGFSFSEWVFVTMNRCRQLYFCLFFIIFFPVSLSLPLPLSVSFSITRDSLPIIFHFIVFTFFAHFIIHQNQIFVGQCGWCRCCWCGVSQVKNYFENECLLRMKDVLRLNTINFMFLHHEYTSSRFNRQQFENYECAQRLLHKFWFSTLL